MRADDPRQIILSFSSIPEIFEQPTEGVPFVVLITGPINNVDVEMGVPCIVLLPLFIHHGVTHWVLLSLSHDLRHIPYFEGCGTNCICSEETHLIHVE